MPEPDQPSSTDRIQDEFNRAAAGFAERTVGRFDAMDVVEFSRVAEGASVLEVGAGTGNFLSLFRDVAGMSIALDLTPGMLVQAKERHPHLKLVQGDGNRLPFRSRSVDLVTSAQAFHHIWEPIPVLAEMRRVAGADGHVLVVDQHSPESYEKTAFMNQLEVIRDPSHAVSRPPSAFRVMMRSAGLEIVDENLWEGHNRFSQWMWPGEFPEERIAATRDFIDRFGGETGMDFERDGDDYIFTRRRIMLLARRV